MKKSSKIIATIAVLALVCVACVSFVACNDKEDADKKGRAAQSDRIEQIFLGIKLCDNHKNVCCKAAKRRVLVADKPETVVHKLEQLVANINAVFLVYQLKSLNIKLNKRNLVVGVTVEHILAAL